jgi:hypothetical protein
VRIFGLGADDKPPPAKSAGDKNVDPCAIDSRWPAAVELEEDRRVRGDADTDPSAAILGTYMPAEKETLVMAEGFVDSDLHVDQRSVIERERVDSVPQETHESDNNVPQTPAGPADRQDAPMRSVAAT